MKSKILKMVLSYLQSKEGLSYERAILRISRVIRTGNYQNNPVLVHLLSVGLPADPKLLHNLMTPGV
ncbi:MAG: hypothetical protein GQ532_07525 [Methylomarinum sp.]|nr:hypothetical protein [Methylomarinum sp.]